MNTTLLLATGVIIATLMFVVGYLYRERNIYSARSNGHKLEANVWKREAEENLEKYNKVLSQKKSSESRIGKISENLIPFLTTLPYDAKNLHHLGNPIDYVYYDYDNAEIIFVEVKSGNSRESKRQKLVKNIIREGRVYYEIVTINDKGIKVKRAKNT